MTTWQEKSKESFVQIYRMQHELFVEVCRTSGTEAPDYLSTEDLFESHIQRQRSLPRRIDRLREHARYTADELMRVVGKEKLEHLASNGAFPRQPAQGMAYFNVALTRSLNAPDWLAAYVAGVRSAIGCCDDLVDKDRFYLVYGNSLFLLSHFMLDLAELALTKTRRLTKEKCAKISNLNIDMIEHLREGERKEDLFKKSYSQVHPFARIVGLFSPEDRIFKDRAAEAASYYDLGTHLLGEMLDLQVGEESYFTEGNKNQEEAAQEIIAAYRKAAEVCPPSELKQCIVTEGQLIEELLSLPDEIAKLAASKKKGKKDYPLTILAEAA